MVELVISKFELSRMLPVKLISVVPTLNDMDVIVPPESEIDPDNLMKSSPKEAEKVLKIGLLEVKLTPVALKRQSPKYPDALVEE